MILVEGWAQKQKLTNKENCICADGGVVADERGAEGTSNESSGGHAEAKVIVSHKRR